MIFARDPSEKPAGASPAPSSHLGLGDGARLVCAHCARPITREGARIEVMGLHIHTGTNEEGYQFQLGCFAVAENLRAVSAPTRHWTWFPGYTWQIEICDGCETHLGWLYRRGEHHFHGLVLPRLLREDA